MFVVVCYDISCDKRRSRVAAVLEEWGTRVQESVFELLLTPPEMDRLRRQIHGMLSAGEDRIRWYGLCAKCVRQTKEEGGPPVTSQPLYYLV